MLSRLRVSLFMLLPAAGCAGPAAGPVPERIGRRAVYVAPVVDETGTLGEVERAKIKAFVLQGIVERTRRERQIDRPPLVAADHPSATALTLTIEVVRFDPEGSPALALLVGFGSFRPGMSVHLRLESSTSSLGDHVFSKVTTAYARTPGGAREAMIHDVTAAAIAFVRRRR